MQKKIEQNNMPEIKLSAGSIKATVWKNHSKKENGEESEYSTITLERVYKDKSGNWQSTNIFRISDLPKVQALLNNLYDTMTVKNIPTSS